MKVLVAISGGKNFADAVESLVAASWRVIHHEDPRENGLLSIPGAVDLVIVECELTSVAPLQILDTVKKLQPGAPVIFLTGESTPEWVEAAYLAGAAYILPRPLRQKLLLEIMDRVLAKVEAAPLLTTGGVLAPMQRESSQTMSATLGTLRHLGEVLTHGLRSELLPKRFLELLREILGVNRAAIFLRRPFSTIKRMTKDAGSTRLSSACAVGLPNALLEYFELSMEGGIARHLHQSGRILRSDAAEIRGDREIQKEFELLGARVAVPILDRETLIGVAVFDERMTGEPFASHELALIFHALEELGLAIKNSWLHDELTQNHDLLTEILDELTSGCVVVGHNLEVMHCNPAARRFLTGKTGGNSTMVEFSDLPQVLGSRVFESLKTGTAVAAFRYKPRENAELAYHVSVIPFDHDHGKTPTAALLLIEDFTQIQHSQRLEIEASNLRMVRSMAEHLSHEIGNALVPMSTHQQLLSEKYDDAEFRGSLSLALTQGIKRISRLSNQLLYLTRDEVPRHESIPALKLIEDAFSDAQTLFGLDGRDLQIRGNNQPLQLDGNRASLLHALSETFLNALQSSPADSVVMIHLDTEKESEQHWAKVQIIDQGAGFTPDLASKATNPFFSTRTVGPGLGLTVAKKIIENHQGRINLVTGEAKGKVAIYLPIKGGSSLLPSGSNTAPPAYVTGQN